MFRYFTSLIAKKKPKQKDALYKFINEASSREKKRFLEQAARQANEEQRKIYYGHVN